MAAADIWLTQIEPEAKAVPSLTQLLSIVRALLRFFVNSLVIFVKASQDLSGFLRISQAWWFRVYPKLTLVW